MQDDRARRGKGRRTVHRQGKAAAAAWDKDAAKTAYEKALQLDPNNAAARDGLKFVATIGEPGFVFRDKLGDGAQGPELVILDARWRWRGTTSRAENSAASGLRRAAPNFAGKEPSCRDRESIFRSSKKRDWENPDITQDDSHPVVCVGWGEAAAYAQWLSKQTGKHYRLPTPAEFDQRRAQGVSRCDCKANLADAAFNKQFDSRDGSDCDDGFAATSPVGTFRGVDGIYDIDGNVREWVAACGSGRRPRSGSRAAISRQGARLAVQSRPRNRHGQRYVRRRRGLNTVGFRVVRDLEK